MAARIVPPVGDYWALLGGISLLRGGVFFGGGRGGGLFSSPLRTFLLRLSPAAPRKCLRIFQADLPESLRSVATALSEVCLSHTPQIPPRGCLPRAPIDFHRQGQRRPPVPIPSADDLLRSDDPGGGRGIGLSPFRHFTFRKFNVPDTFFFAPTSAPPLSLPPPLSTGLHTPGRWEMGDGRWDITTPGFL